MIYRSTYPVSQDAASLRYFYLFQLNAQRTFLQICRDLKLVARVARDHLKSTTLQNALGEGPYTANIVETVGILST